MQLVNANANNTRECKLIRSIKKESKETHLKYAAINWLEIIYNTRKT